MIVLESKISDVTRNRDFGMIEARVTLFAKVQAGQPPHPIKIRTHVPARGDTPLRQRLVADATVLASALGARQAHVWRDGHRAA